jgi:hypothetical protein
MNAISSPMHDMYIYENEAWYTRLTPGAAYLLVGQQ